MEQGRASPVDIIVTRNRPGKPLFTHQAIVNLIGATTTWERLLVTNRIRARERRISDEALAQVNLEPRTGHVTHVEYEIQFPTQSDR